MAITHKSSRKRNALKEGHSKGAWWPVATWFGCGLSPITSGTVGSLGALPFAYVIHSLLGGAALFGAGLLMFAVGVWASNQYLIHMESSEDPGEIVVDEVAGQWLLLSVLPATLPAYIVGFLLFRAFDIVKPWPISLADRKIKGGFGVMFDDILAGVIPALGYVLLLWAAPQFGFGDYAAMLEQFLGGNDVP
jgi:phosphatidylglycerophosphatase A